MKRLKPMSILFLFVALFLFGACGGSASNSESENSHSVSNQDNVTKKKEVKVAPDFILDGFQASFFGEGDEVIYRKLEGIKLSDFRDKLVLIEFWGSRCSYCEIHMPTIEKAYRRYKNKDFVVIGIELHQFTLTNPEDAKRFVEEYKITFPILLDGVDNLYDIEYIPQAILIGPDGVIIRRFLGPSYASYDWNSTAAKVFIEKHLPKTMFARLDKEGGKGDER